MRQHRQFGELANTYEDFSRLPFRQHLEFPSILSLIGIAAGERILGLGCGSGSRHLTRHGAQPVTGVDQDVRCATSEVIP
ncbi:hypothetical protein ABT282_07675 [Streptomyces sp. NPDC000927]|uniref:hypothetical protein n=1 Tax=Streptomyces sp. NPDC000927 TaxID=3154371 RepID=UPI00331D7EC4